MAKKLEDLDCAGVQELLRKSDKEEFVEFVVEKELDGRKLMHVTEGIVKLWRPQINANKLILFIQDLKTYPEKYIDFMPESDKMKTNTQKDSIELIKECMVKTTEKDIITVTIEEGTKMSIESQYQTVKKIKEDNITFSNVEEIIKKIVPAKSFLYRNQGKKPEATSYLPMNAGTPKKRKIFRLSAYDYPIFDLKRLSKPEGERDRGYYPMKRNSRYFTFKTKSPESRSKYKSISTTEELKYPEDHFYEDLCYNEVEKRGSVSSAQVKPYRVKIQELFQSFKMPFFRKSEEVSEEVKKVKELEEKRVVVDEGPMYENTDSIANMYDSVHVQSPDSRVKEEVRTKLPVEEYLEPVQLTKEYCDVTYKHRDESIMGYIMSIFETHFGYRRETNDIQTEDSDPESPDLHKWSEDKAGSTMAGRPLPIPVENESYYMDIERTEAENLLRGQPDGTFVLRPSSQPNHAYTISVACSSAVHNVGIRRRPDGRLALGFSRKTERSFPDVGSLLRHHKKRRLLLVANGAVIGATTLNESAQYYQTPCNIPVKII